MADAHREGERPLLSVVIPVHDAVSVQDDLQRSIKAWLHLPDPGVQVIVVLDGPSEDLGWLVIDPEDLKSGRLDVARLTARRGPGIARTEGLHRSVGHTVYFMDADDTVDAPVIFQIAATLLAARQDIAVFGYKVHDFRGSKATQRVMLPAANLRSLTPALLRDAAVWRFVFLSCFLRGQHLQFPPLRMGEDLIFLLRAAEKQPSVLSFPVVAYEHYLRLGSLSNARRIPASRYQRLLSLLTSEFLLGRVSARTRSVAFIWFARISRRLTMSLRGSSPTPKLDEK